MSFKPFLREDSFTRDKSSKISIRKQHLAFNSAFVKEGNILKYNKVKIFVDNDNFMIGFEFHNDNDSDNLYTLFSDNKTTNNTRAISCVQLKNRFPFIKRISDFENSIDRQFEVKQDNKDKKLWIAVLCPAFENKVSSESELRNVYGIYRYKRSTGEIVYIGKGKILSRLNSNDRKQWDFDIVEYSIIKDPKEQLKWESYWLNKFIEYNDKLPFYNKIRGNSQT